ncbi:MAG: YbaB/EbfC family nucleoid-associated protein [Planctomycetota bacterium]|nr:YbaB/EbfC family nucleoid-associated protein [Planctomycetota bacterium]
MFDNLKNLGALMTQAREMKQRMEQIQAELAGKTVEADSGAGAVRVVMNGKFEVLSIRLDRAVLASLLAPSGGGGAAAASADDQRMVEDLIAAAVNAAMRKAQELAAAEMGKVTGGMNLPGLEKLMGG